MLYLGIIINRRQWFGKTGSSCRQDYVYIYTCNGIALNPNLKPPYIVNEITYQQKTYTDNGSRT